MNALIDLEKCREYMTITIGGRDHMIKLSGTFDNPYFCGRDVCNVLGYSDTKKALNTHVDFDGKTHLKTITASQLSYNDGKAVYINKKGLEQLISRSKKCGPDTLQWKSLTLIFR